MKLATCLCICLGLLAARPAMAEGEREQKLADIHTQLASAYYARGQYGVALEEVKSAMEAVSEYAPAYNVRGLIYTDLKEWATAEENFLRAIKLEPLNSDANHNYGWYLCSKRNKYAESVKYFYAALKNPLYKTPEKSLQQAGNCALKAGDLATAEDALQKADRLQPNNPQSLLSLAQLAWRKGQAATARDLLFQQGKLTAATAESLWLSVRVEHKLGNAEPEVGFTKELKTRFPDSEEAHLLAEGKYD